MKHAISSPNIGASTQTPDKAIERIGQRYRFERLALSIILRDLYFSRDDPGPGDRVLEFDLPTIDGGRFRSCDLTGAGPVLLIFGSVTCPMTDSAVPGLNALHDRFGKSVRFVMVDVREAHPGNTFPQPMTSEGKMAHARQLRTSHNLRFEVAVDDIDGTLHRALSPKPNSAYILAPDKTIIFRAHWANDTDALAEALNALTTGGALQRTQSSGLIKPMLRMFRHLAPVLDRAGGGAWADMWRVMPPLAALALALKTLRIRPHPCPEIKQGD